MAEEKSIEYEGKTLVRSGNTVFYGKKDEGIWLQITIMGTKKVADLDLATNTFIQIVDYNDGNTKILKQSFGTSFSESFELGSIWLDRALKGTLS